MTAGGVGGKQPAVVAKPGIMGRIWTWPPFERVPGLPAPHPVLITKVFATGLVRVFPMTHSAAYFCSKMVDIDPIEMPHAIKPFGPLNPPPDKTWLCLKDLDGDGMHMDAEPRTYTLYFPAMERQIALTHIVDLGSAWPRLEAKIRAAVA